MKRLQQDFTPHVFGELRGAGVVSLIDFAYGFSSEIELPDFLLCNGVVANQEVGPSGVVAGNESRVQSESLVALVCRAASWRPVATSRFSTRPSHLTGVCRWRLERLRSKPGTAVVPNPPALETLHPPDIEDTTMRMYLDVAEVGIKWHPVDGTDDEALRKELALAPFVQSVDFVRSRIPV